MISVVFVLKRFFRENCQTVEKGNLETTKVASFKDRIRLCHAGIL